MYDHCHLCVKSGAMGLLLTVVPALSLRTMGESTIVTLQLRMSNLAQCIYCTEQCTLQWVNQPLLHCS